MKQSLNSISFHIWTSSNLKNSLTLNLLFKNMTLYIYKPHINSCSSITNVNLELLWLLWYVVLPYHPVAKIFLPFPSTLTSAQLPWHVTQHPIQTPIPIFNISWMVVNSGNWRTFKIDSYSLTILRLSTNKCPIQRHSAYISEVILGINIHGPPIAILRPKTTTGINSIFQIISHGLTVVV